VQAVEAAGESTAGGADKQGPGKGVRFLVRTEAGPLLARSVVMATGGMAIPKAGASDLGLRIARSFGLRIVEPRPALVPLSFDARTWAAFSGLAGLALPVVVRAPNASDSPAFDEDLLFTHRGLSGPAVLQISTFWRSGEPLAIDLARGEDLGVALLAEKRSSRQQLGTALGSLLPRRLAGQWLAEARFSAFAPRKLAEVPDRELVNLAAALRDWRIVPSGTEGYRKAEVMAGGVATDELDPRTMQARRVPGLYFIGEVVDITGWLGGYNFQWAWASGYLAGQAVGHD
jgi:predicted Rossmann fold flavoprotein